MAPPQEDTDRHNAQDDSSNPFISFRRFADEQISSFMRNVFGLSSMTPPDRRLQDYQTWLREARESRNRLNREADEADRTMDLYTRAHNEGQDPAHQELQRAIQADIEGLRCPYKPVECDTPSERSQPSTRENQHAHSASQALWDAPAEHEFHRIFGSPFFGLQLASLPVAYLLHSPYSPVNLEEQQALRDHGIDWREAFEDLLSAQKGQGMPPEDLHRPFQSSAEWMKGILSTGVDQVGEDNQEDLDTTKANTKASAEGPNRRVSMWDADHVSNDAVKHSYEPDVSRDKQEGYEETTELDVYDHFLGRAQAPKSKATARSFAHLQHDSLPADTDGKTICILSTLTTTERIRLQDGTVHTKTILKKRFSDGREVETETSHTQTALPQGQRIPQMQDKEERGGKRSGGWFWS